MDSGNRVASQSTVAVDPSGVGATSFWSAAGLGVLVLGGMFTFGSSTEVSSLKVIYAVLLTLIASLTAWDHFQRPAPLSKRPAALVLGVVAWLLSGTFAASALLSPLDNAVEAVRQGLSYFLIPISPFLGVQLGWRLSPKLLHIFVLSVGIASSMSFGLDWVARRGVGSIETGRFVLGSPVLSSLAFALGIVLTFHARGIIRLLGGIAVVIIPVALLITGTRTNLIIVLVVLALIGSRTKFRVPRSGVAWIVLLAAVSVAALGVLAPIFLQDPSFLQVRLRSLLTISSGGVIDDQSFLMRADQYNYAYSIIEQSPWFGKGFAWIPAMFLDTPLATPARIGIIGASLLGVFLLLSMWLVRRAASEFGPSAFTASARGVAIFVVALLPFGPPVEDRGFALAAILLFAGISSEAREVGRENDSRGVGKDPNRGFEGGRKGVH